jgi:hypothetical protein
MGCQGVGCDCQRAREQLVDQGVAALSVVREPGSRVCSVVRQVVGQQAGQESGHAQMQLHTCLVLGMACLVDIGLRWLQPQREGCNACKITYTPCSWQRPVSSASQAGAHLQVPQCAALHLHVCPTAVAVHSNVIWRHGELPALHLGMALRDGCQPWWRWPLPHGSSGVTSNHPLLVPFGRVTVSEHHMNSCIRFTQHFQLVRPGFLLKRNLHEH